MEETTESLTRPQRIAVIGIAALVALTRFVPLSKGPWDWDEVLFCLALQDYNVAAHQPHPAGFPLYILLGRIAHFFFASEFHALQAVNVLAAMTIFPLAFLLARAFRFDFIGAFSAALLFAFLPNVWFYGGTAFSDVPALAFYLGAIVAYLFARQRVSVYLLACVLLAAAMLIRPQNALLAVFPWTLATVRLVRAKRIAAAVASNIATVLIVAAGYGIAAWATGFDAYALAVRNHGKYVQKADTVAAQHRAPLTQVVREHLDPYEAGKASILINVLALAALIAGRGRVITEVLLTFAPYFLFTLLAVHPLGASRFSLGYMAGMVLLAIEGTRALARFVPRFEVAIRFAVLAVIVGRLGTWVLPAFEQPRKTDSPPAQAAMWLARNVPATSTIFVEGNIWPWARYYLPKHHRVGVDQATKIVSNPAARDGWYLCNETTTAGTAKVFRRPRNRTWNIVTQRCFEAYVMPAASVIEFGRGWHFQEGDAYDSWRWSSRSAVMKLGPAGPNAELHLKFNVPVHAVKRPIRVRFALNGTPLGEVVATKDEQEVRYVVDARGDAQNVLTIDVDPAFVPAHYGSHDTRELGIMLRQYTWRRGA